MGKYLTQTGFLPGKGIQIIIHVSIYNSAYFEGHTHTRSLWVPAPASG